MLSHHDEAFLSAVPKTDLHVHLDGSLRETTLIDLARERAVSLPSQTVEGLNALVFRDARRPCGVPRGLCLHHGGPAGRRRAGAGGHELAQDTRAEGPVVESASPAVHMHAGLSFDAVLLAVNRGPSRAREEHERSEVVKRGTAFRYGIIVCALRWFTADFSRWYAQLCGLLRDDRTRPSSRRLPRTRPGCCSVSQRTRRSIVGLTCWTGGRVPGQDYAEVAYAHRHFLQKTVHAGEAYGPESIFEAITECTQIAPAGLPLVQPSCAQEIEDPAGTPAACRVHRSAARHGRGLHLLEPADESVHRNGPQPRLSAHAQRKMPATLCTDNRLVSHTTVTRGSPWRRALLT